MCVCRDRHSHAARVTAAIRIAGELVDTKAFRGRLTVNAHHHALTAESCRQPVDQIRIGQGRGIHRHLFGTGVEDGLGIGHCADAAGHAEGNVGAVFLAGGHEREGGDDPELSVRNLST
jgi:hypothetical protein